MNSQIALDGSEIFALRNGTLSSFIVDSGATNWMWKDAANSNLNTQSLATQNMVIISGTNSTCLIDRASHQQVQKLDAGGKLASADGKLYVASSDGLRVYNISTSVPEPATYALMGLVGLAFIRRR